MRKTQKKSKIKKRILKISSFITVIMIIAGVATNMLYFTTLRTHAAQSNDLTGTLSIKNAYIFSNKTLEGTSKITRAQADVAYNYISTGNIDNNKYSYIDYIKTIGKEFTYNNSEKITLQGSINQNTNPYTNQPTQKIHSPRTGTIGNSMIDYTVLNNSNGGFNQPTTGYMRPWVAMEYEITYSKQITIEDIYKIYVGGEAVGAKSGKYYVYVTAYENVEDGGVPTANVAPYVGESDLGTGIMYGAEISIEKPTFNKLRVILIYEISNPPQDNSYGNVQINQWTNKNITAKPIPSLDTSYDSGYLDGYSKGLTLGQLMGKEQYHYVLYSWFVNGDNEAVYNQMPQEIKDLYDLVKEKQNEKGYEEGFANGVTGAREGFNIWLAYYSYYKAGLIDDENYNYVLNWIDGFYWDLLMKSKFDEIWREAQHRNPELLDVVWDPRDPDLLGWTYEGWIVSNIWQAGFFTGEKNAVQNVWKESVTLITDYVNWQKQNPDKMPSEWTSPITNDENKNKIINLIKSLTSDYNRTMEDAYNMGYNAGVKDTAKGAENVLSVLMTQPSRWAGFIIQTVATVPIVGQMLLMLIAAFFTLFIIFSIQKFLGGGMGG